MTPSPVPARLDPEDLARIAAAIDRMAATMAALTDVARRTAALVAEAAAVLAEGDG